MTKISTLILLFIIPTCFAASYVNWYNNPEVSTKPPIFPDKEKDCVKWENVCVEHEHCTQRAAFRNGGCYRCLKPSHYGVHLYPRMQSRDTCNYDTAQYLRTMGYRCYIPYENSTCLNTIKTQDCHMKCIEYRGDPEQYDY